MSTRDLKSSLQSRFAWWMNRAPAIIFDRLRGVDTIPGGFAGDVAAAELGRVYAYDPTPWRVLSRSLRVADLRAENFTFVDVGCGKGRVLLSALALPFERIIGIELSPAFCRIAQQNITNARLISRRCTAVEIICSDATKYQIPRRPMIMFFCNPFPFEIMEIVLSNIVNSYTEDARPIYLIFCACSSMMPSIAEFLPARTGGHARRCVSTTISGRTVNIFELPHRRV
jgi:SAM-dependent methyltransferase